MGCKRTTLGTLYGVGIGPGDPELITLKAVRILKEVDKVFAASSSSNEYSIAKEIVDPHLAQDTPVERLPFPMTRDKAVLVEAWRANGERVVELLRQGKDVAFITLGDPLTYSTFCHLMKQVKALEPSVEIVTIPGITSYHAAAARLNAPIAQGERGFYVVSGVNGGGEIRGALERSDTVFVLKAYRKFDSIRKTLDDLGLTKRAVVIKRLGLDGEGIIKDISTLDEDEKMPYLSLVVIQNLE